MVKTVGYWLKWLGGYLSKDTSLASLQEIFDRIRTCPECMEKNKCVECGCNFENMVKVRKPCSKYRIK